MAVLSASICAEHITRQILIMRVNALGIYFSVKLLDHVSISFIFSELKKFQELWGWRMQSYKWIPQIKCLLQKERKRVYLVSFAGSPKCPSRFKGWVGYRCWQTLTGGHRDMSGWHKQGWRHPTARTLGGVQNSKTTQCHGWSCSTLTVDKHLRIHDCEKI